MESMEYTYTPGLFSLLQALAAGLALGLYYDVFRLLRRLFRFSAFSVAMQDILFWCSAAVGLFFVCLRWNADVIRVYFVFFTLIGWLLYLLTAGQLNFLVLDGVKKPFSRIFEKMHNAIIHIVERFYQKLK